MTPVLFAEVTIDASEHRDAHWFDRLWMGLLTPKYQRHGNGEQQIWICSKCLEKEKIVFQMVVFHCDLPWYKIEKKITN